MQSEGPLELLFSTGEAREEQVHGICALMWARPADAPLRLRVRRGERRRPSVGSEGGAGSDTPLASCKLGAEGLATLSKAMTPTLATLDLEASSCADQGGENLEGVHVLCTALGEHEYSGGLLSLCLARNKLGDVAAGALAQALRRNHTLTHLDLHHNPLGGAAACAVPC